MLGLVQSDLDFVRAALPVTHSLAICLAYEQHARPRLSHETRRLPHGHVDGVKTMQHRVDAIDATRTTSAGTFAAPRERRTKGEYLLR